MKITVAPDSFKGSLTAPQAAAAIASGLRRVLPDACIVELPVADGGEGTADVIAAATGAVRHDVTVSDPLGRPVTAPFYMMTDGTAVLDLASASGLTLVEPELRNPIVASTYGTGELIAAAAAAGAKQIIAGLGGSATVDGGEGMLRALGYRFDGRPMHLPFALIAACDVNTPLCRAAEIYGPQKGATPQMVELLKSKLERLGQLYGDRDEPGGGAAGGVGAAMRCVLGAQIVSGIDIVLETIRFRERAAGSDIVITGEGCMDAQTLRGKAPSGVLRAARAVGINTIAGICGMIRDREALIAAGFSSLTAINHPGPGAAGALSDAASQFAEKHTKSKKMQKI